MKFPEIRLRRLRENPSLRKILTETSLSVNDLVYPLFVVPGRKIKKEINSLPEQYHFSVDKLAEEAKFIQSLGIKAVLLFGTPEKKDKTASGAWAENGIIQQAIKAIKKVAPDLVVITDVCMCGYTTHGHCGIVKDNYIDNDATLEYLAKIALSQAKSGSDIIAPSDMMDGRVGRIRKELDKNGFEKVLILSYAAKMASAFYGPFREAVDSAPAFGDRKSYQMNPANLREALGEISLDIQEGADIVMIKPALAYLDIIKEARRKFLTPIAAYNVSGEYLMVKSAAKSGFINERDVILEILTGIKRAGADLIITYHAKETANWINKR